MPTTRNLIWTSFIVVGALLTGWMGMRIALSEPLGWMHDANGTFPALQAPIDAVITLALTALVAAVIYRGLARRRAIMAARDTRHSTNRTPANDATAPVGGFATTPPA